MNISALYEQRENILGRIFADLQANTQSLTPVLKDPEVIKDQLLMDFIAFNYTFAFHRIPKSLIMGEIGGVLPMYGNKRVLAISESSIKKVISAAEALSNNNKALAENITELPVEEREKIKIVNGNRNAAHYDFITVAGKSNPLDILQLHTYLLLGAEGFTVVSNKSLPGQMYLFNVPFNRNLFEQLPDNAEERLPIIKSLKQMLMPEGFIAGFRIRYKDKKILVSPVIGEGEKMKNEPYFRKKSINPEPSEICLMGISSPYGGLTSIMENSLC